MSDERPTKIFISHAHMDKPLVDSLLNNILDLGCQIPRENIFCSSSDGTGVRYGKEWIADIKANLIKAELVIFVLSPNFYASQVCLNELGAAWILDKDLFPMVVPIDDSGVFEYPKGILQIRISDSMNSRTNLELLRDTALKACGLTHLDSGNWLNHKTTFLESFNHIRSQLPKPMQISEEEFQAVQEDVTVYKHRWEKAKAEVERLAKENKDIRGLTADELRSYDLENMDDWEELETRTSEIARNIANTDPSYVVCEMLHHNFFSGEPYDPNRNESWEDFEKAHKHQYLYWIEGQGYVVSNETSIMEEILDALSELSDWLQSRESDFHKLFKEENGYPPSLKNIDFWKQYLGL